MLTAFYFFFFFWVSYILKRTQNHMQREQRHPRPFWLNTRTRLSRSSGDRSRVSSTGLGMPPFSVRIIHRIESCCWLLAYGLLRLLATNWLHQNSFVLFVRSPGYTRLSQPLLYEWTMRYDFQPNYTEFVLTIYGVRSAAGWRTDCLLLPVHLA